MKWVQSLKFDKLFLDTSDSFSKWYNRDEQRKDGYLVQGFESKYITTDKMKCFYSLRHSFAAELNYISSDYKAVIDLMGHSTKQYVTARYTGPTSCDFRQGIRRRATSKAPRRMPACGRK